jgi:DNA primase
MIFGRFIALIERKRRARREAAKDKIVMVVGSRIALKKRGNRHVGLCPFHPDRNPSFFVNPARGRFFCFGCQAGGSAEDFLRLYAARARPT